MRETTKQGVALAAMLLAVLASTGRAADAPPSPYFQVDLSKQVTHSLYEPMLKTPGSDLSALATGTPADQTPRKTLKGIPFRFDGVVLVGPGLYSPSLTGEQLPQ